MSLNLSIAQASGGGDRQTRSLAQGTLSIGRAPGNDWVLADPDQHLSRTHCMVAFESGRYWIIDRSTNGLLINGAREPTSRDSRTVLTDGDSVQLGDYLLEVAEVEDHPAPPGPFGAPGFSGGFSGAGGDPFDVDPLGDPPGQAGSSGFHHPMAHTPPSLRAEDPFDFAGQQHDAGGDEDLFRGETPLDAWNGPAQRDTVDAPSHAFAAPRAVTPMNLDDIDFDALLGDIMPTPAAHPLEPRPQPVAPPRPAPPAALPDDPFGETPPVAASVAAAPVQVATASPSASLLDAFLEGAGLTPADLPSGDPEATMRAIGALFRAFVGGTREVLMSRAEIKHEMRVEQTMIRSRDNNALKFSLSPEEALVALLRPSRPGYKLPLDSVEEAFNDIRSHEMAVMAGMQTALVALLKRFDPAGLETRLQRGMLDGIMPGARKARFWELFCATYKDLSREAADDFNAVFGRDFARAYDAQVSKL